MIEEYQLSEIGYSSIFMVKVLILQNPENESVTCSGDTKQIMRYLNN